MVLSLIVLVLQARQSVYISNTVKSLLTSLLSLQSVHFLVM